MTFPESGPQKCPHCGSTNIATSIDVTQQAEVGRVGLNYKTRFLGRGTEPFFADLCDNCGTVVRIFVKKTGRDWSTK